jgi:hypothetical protein
MPTQKQTTNKINTHVITTIIWILSPFAFTLIPVFRDTYTLLLYFFVITTFEILFLIFYPLSAQKKDKIIVFFLGIITQCLSIFAWAIHIVKTSEGECLMFGYFLLYLLIGIPFIQLIVYALYETTHLLYKKYQCLKK